MIYAVGLWKINWTHSHCNSHTCFSLCFMKPVHLAERGGRMHQPYTRNHLEVDVWRVTTHLPWCRLRHSRWKGKGSPQTRVWSEGQIQEVMQFKNTKLGSLCVHTSLLIQHASGPHQPQLIVSKILKKKLRIIMYYNHCNGHNMTLIMKSLKGLSRDCQLIRALI